MSNDRDDNGDLRVVMARGLSALKVLIDERTNRIDRVERLYDELSTQTRERLVKLETNYTNIKEDITGAHDIRAEVFRAKGKEEAFKELRENESEEKKVTVETWKSTAPIYVAIITAGGALITGIINLFLHFLGSGGE